MDNLGVLSGDGDDTTNDYTSDGGRVSDEEKMDKPNSTEPVSTIDDKVASVIETQYLQQQNSSANGSSKANSTDQQRSENQQSIHDSDLDENENENVDKSNANEKENENQDGSKASGSHKGSGTGGGSVVVNESNENDEKAAVNSDDSKGGDNDNNENNDKNNENGSTNKSGPIFGDLTIDKVEKYIEEHYEAVDDNDDDAIVNTPSTVATGLLASLKNIRENDLHKDLNLIGKLTYWVNQSILNIFDKDKIECKDGYRIRLK